MSAAKCLS